jgi:hypothetical protein
MTTRWPDGFKPQYWSGDRWVQEERATLPGGITAAELPAFLASEGIPGTAELTAITEYDEDGPVVQLRWLTGVPEEKAGGDRA